MANIKVRVGAENKIRVIPSIGPVTLAALYDVDIDTTNLDDGYVLVYNSSSNKWTSTDTLDAGSF